LGAGTGRFSQALADGLSVSVVAMEPAAGMRAEAVASLSSPRVHLVGGSAQGLPFDSQSFDMVWASQVLHHVLDMGATAREINRVLKPDGSVLVRASLDSGDWILAPFFLEMPAAGSKLPRLSDYVSAFEGAGFELLLHEKVHQVVAPDGWALLERTKLRADSVLARLGDAAFAKGIAALTRAVQEEEVAAPVLENLDLLVFGNLKKSKQLPVGG